MAYFLGFLIFLGLLIALIFSIPSIRKSFISQYKKAHDESLEKTYKAVIGESEESKK